MDGQLRIDDLDQPLSDATFVIVDLETTGGAAAEGGITEIGAVKVRAGVVLGEYQSLVNPGTPIPPYITALTGISDSTVAHAPTLAGVMPSFLEFISGATLVAHNAAYDVGFLRGATALLGHDWPEPRVVDTLRMARAALQPGEVTNRKLATLAAHFSAPTPPTHRALDDARATVHVFHALLERLASAGVVRLDDLMRLGPRIAARRASKRSLADGLPTGPGVYIFRDAQGRPLYIGKSRNVSSRVRSYFSAAETRERMERMLDLTTSVHAIPCATDTEALIREHRLLTEHRPPFNRAGVRFGRTVWLRLTDERYPRLAIVRERVEARALVHLGPFASRTDAELARDAIASVIPVRTCSEPIPVRAPRSACALADMGRCAAPCDHRIDASAYRDIATEVLALCNGDGATLVDHLTTRQRELAAQERFEEAAMVRDRLLAWIQGNERRQRFDTLASVPHLVAGGRVEKGWEVHVIRFGRLASAGRIPDGADHVEALAAIIATAEHVEPRGTVDAVTVRETTLLSAWLAQPGVRLIDGAVASPFPSAASLASRFAGALDAREHAQALLEHEFERAWVRRRGAR